MKEITEYNARPVSVVMCVWEGGGGGVQVGGATVGGWRSKGVWCHNQDPGSISVVWG